MWRVESGVNEGQGMEELVVHMLINTDSKGKELQRAGTFASLNEAEHLALVLNQINVHSAAVIANYLGIYSYLESYVVAQEEQKQQQRAKEVIDQVCRAK